MFLYGKSVLIFILILISIFYAEGIYYSEARLDIIYRDLGGSVTGYSGTLPHKINERRVRQEIGYLFGSEIFYNYLIREFLSSYITVPGSNVRDPRSNVNDTEINIFEGVFDYETFRKRFKVVNDIGSSYITLKYYSRREGHPVKALNFIINNFSGFYYDRLFEEQKKKVSLIEKSIDKLGYRADILGIYEQESLLLSFYEAGISPVLRVIDHPSDSYDDITIFTIRFFVILSSLYLIVSLLKLILNRPRVR